MSRLRYKMKILGTIFGIAVAAAVVWFCLAGGKRQTKQSGTLVQLNGVPCKAAAEQAYSPFPEEAA